MTLFKMIFQGSHFTEIADGWSERVCWSQRRCVIAGCHDISKDAANTEVPAVLPRVEWAWMSKGTCTHRMVLQKWRCIFWNLLISKSSVAEWKALHFSLCKPWLYNCIYSMWLNILFEPPWFFMEKLTQNSFSINFFDHRIFFFPPHPWNLPTHMKQMNEISWSTFCSSVRWARFAESRSLSWVVWPLWQVIWP